MNLTELSTTIEGILFILVIYKKRLNESDSFTSLVDSLKNTHLNIDIFIYDNSPSAMILQEELSGGNWKIHYVHDETNPGVSKAYNEGFRLGKKMNKKWLLLLDQDTKLPKDAIIKYCRALQDNGEYSLVAPILVSTNGIIYSPCNYFFKRGFPMKSIEIGLVKARRKSLLNSGLLISMDIFEKVGGYNEKLKLDFSDFEFLDRYRKISDQFFIINTECIHELSSNEEDMRLSITNFTRYCKGLKIYIVADFDSFCLLCITLIRACKLSFRFRSIDFISVFCRYTVF